MSDKETIKLALEALETAWYHVGTFCPTDEAIELYDEARAAIKEALAQPEQEPVAWADHGVVNWIVDKQFKHASYLYEGQPPASFKACVYCGQMVVKEKNT
jgi:bisphosphoglycerate-independent phosphoglycerate mutase (AlkP superfamily)